MNYRCHKKYNTLHVTAPYDLDVDLLAHWKLGPNLSSLRAPQVVVMTTCGGSDDKAIIHGDSRFSMHCVNDIHYRRLGNGLSTFLPSRRLWGRTIVTFYHKCPRPYSCRRIRCSVVCPRDPRYPCLCRPCQIAPCGSPCSGWCRSGDPHHPSGLLSETRASRALFSVQ